MSGSQEFIATEETPPVIVAALKHWLPDRSWSQIRKLLSSRRIQIGAALCLDESRRLAPGERVFVFEDSLPKPPTIDDVEVQFVDRDIVVVDKPSRMVTLRHKKERGWVKSKKALQPALDEVLPDLVYGPDREDRPPLLSVHRIDRDTSGLLIFARREHIQEQLIALFAKHDIQRIYRAIVFGRPAAQTLTGRLVRDRGDGLRGSSTNPAHGKAATTHVKPLRTFQVGGTSYSEVECRLETGRTHQIRIHLAEIGHPVCGDHMYRGGFEQPPIDDQSGAPRLALHATRLGLIHPGTGEELAFESGWPRDMQRFLIRLENGGKKAQNKKAQSNKQAAQRSDRR